MFLFGGRYMVYLSWFPPFVHIRKGCRMREIQNNESGIKEVVPYKGKIPEGWHDVNGGK